MPSYLGAQLLAGNRVAVTIRNELERHLWLMVL